MRTGITRIGSRFSMAARTRGTWMDGFSRTRKITSPMAFPRDEHRPEPVSDCVRFGKESRGPRRAVAREFWPERQWRVCGAGKAGWRDDHERIRVSRAIAQHLLRHRPGSACDTLRFKWVSRDGVHPDQQ